MIKSRSNTNTPLQPFTSSRNYFNTLLKTSFFFFGDSENKNSRNRLRKPIAASHHLPTFAISIGIVLDISYEGNFPSFYVTVSCSRLNTDYQGQNYLMPLETICYFLNVYGETYLPEMLSVLYREQEVLKTLPEQEYSCSFVFV